MAYFSVFIGNKLISCDTVVPILLAVKEKNKHAHITVYCLNNETKAHIEKNIVLYTAIKKVGSLISISAKGEGRIKRVKTYLSSIFRLILLSIRSLFLDQKIIHFGLLEDWRFRVLYLLSPSKTYYMENNCWGWSNLVYEVDNMYKERVINKSINSAKNIIAFSKDHPVYIESNSLKFNRYLLTPSRLWPVWQKFIKNDAEKIWLEECTKYNVNKTEKVILYILGTLGDLDYISPKNAALSLFLESIPLIKNHYPQTKIFIKPHPITDTKVLMNEIKKLGYDNIVCSYLHPSLISNHALFSICNYYSTTMADSYSNNIPTIEYTSYSAKTLELTNNNSLRPEYISYFIQRNKNELNKVLSKISKKNYLSNIKSNQLSSVDKDLLRSL